MTNNMEVIGGQYYRQLAHAFWGKELLTQGKPIKIF